MKQRVLVLSEDQNVRTALLRLLEDCEAFEIAAVGRPAAILVGCHSRLASDDLAQARAISRSGDGIPIILITSDGSENLAVDAMRAGIANYLHFPSTSMELDQVLDSALPSQTSGPDEFQPAEIRNMARMVGESAVIKNLKKYLLRAAACSANVLVTGETGCGKEMVSELIHEHSPRAARTFVTVNCAAIPDTLFESELFGFERGAFTGASVAQDGKLKLADHGTVFLDEIGDLSPFAQAKLLRVIESGEIQRLGGRKAQKIDVRFVAATNHDLETDPHFRRDLFFRLNVARIHLPPLRERKEDILPLAEMFRAQFGRSFGRCTSGFTPSAQELMLAHSWPGNIRELRNVIEAAFIDLPGGEYYVELPLQFRKAIERCVNAAPGELERILLALSETHWNKSRAAERLRWSRMTLYRKIAQYRICKAAIPA